MIPACRGRSDQTLSDIGRQLAMPWLAALMLGSAALAALASPLPPGWRLTGTEPITLAHGRSAPIEVLVQPPRRSAGQPSTLVTERSGESAAWRLVDCQPFPNQADSDSVALRLCQTGTAERIALAIGLRRQDGQLQRLIGTAPARSADQLAARTLELAAIAESGGLDAVLAQGESSRIEPAAAERSGSDRAAVAVHGVYAQWMSTGAAMYARPRVLFASGDVLKDMSLPPGEVGIAAPGSRNPADWGRWQLRDNQYHIEWDDGSDSSWPLDSATFFPVHPGRRGLRLEGRFRAMSTMSVAEPQGGQLTTAAWSTLSLGADGRFVQGQGLAAAGSGVAAHGIQLNQHGEYHIDGHAIEFRFADGRIERTGFFIVAGRDYDGQAPDVVGIGNTVFTRSTSSRR